MSEQLSGEARGNQESESLSIQGQAYREVLSEVDVERFKEYVKAGIAGSQTDRPGNYLFEGKTPIEAAEFLSNNADSNGTIGALELTDLSVEEKAPILAQAYDKDAEIVERELKKGFPMRGTGNPEVDRERIERDRGKAEKLRGSKSE